MSAKQKTSLDETIQAAFEALDRVVPEGHFDELESKLQARLEQESMTETAEHGTAASQEPGREPLTAATLARSASNEPGSQDIRALAETTKKRISQRISAQIEAQEPLPSSSLAMRTISLPEPGKDFQVYATDRGARPAVALPEQQKSPAWVYAAASAAAAAAVVFFLVRGQDREPVRVTSQDTAANMTQPGGAWAPAMDGTGHTGDVGGQPVPDDRALLQEPAPPAGSMESGGAADTASAPAAQGLTAGPSAGDQKVGSAAKNVATTTPRDAIKAPPAGGAGAATRTKADRAPADEEASDDKSDGDTAAGTKEAQTTPADKPKPSDTLDDLLTEASGGAARPGGEGEAKKDADETKPKRMKREPDEIKTAMSAVEGKAQACFARFQVPGTVMIRFSVEPDGRVTSAQATGPFKGTDTGACVADAVKSARLSAYDGPPTTYNYAFLLTQ